jgi:hypothetical protein
VGLAEKVMDGWVRGDRDPVDVARELGTAGEQQRRRERYAEHQRNRARWMSRRRQPGESSG